jgi:hypothetical protein
MGDLGVMGVIRHPDKIDPPLIVDSNTLLSGPIPFQSFLPITGRCDKILQVRCVVEHHESPLYDLPEAEEFPDQLSGKELLGLLVSKPSTHTVHPITFLRITYNVCAKIVLIIFENE